MQILDIKTAEYTSNFSPVIAGSSTGSLILYNLYNVGVDGKIDNYIDGGSLKSYSPIIFTVRQRRLLSNL